MMYIGKSQTCLTGFELGVHMMYIVKSQTCLIGFELDGHMMHIGRRWTGFERFLGVHMREGF